MQLSGFKTRFLLFFSFLLSTSALTGSTVFSLDPATDPNVTGLLVVSTSTFDVVAFDARGNELMAVVDTVTGPLGFGAFGELLFGAPPFPNSTLYATDDLISFVQHGLDLTSIVFLPGIVTIDSNPLSTVGTLRPALSAFNQALTLTFAITSTDIGTDGNAAFGLLLSGVAPAVVIPEPGSQLLMACGFSMLALAFVYRRHRSAGSVK